MVRGSGYLKFQNLVFLVSDQGSVGRLVPGTPGPGALVWIGQKITFAVFDIYQRHLVVDLSFVELPNSDLYTTNPKNVLDFFLTQVEIERKNE